MGNKKDSNSKIKTKASKKSSGLGRQRRANRELHSLKSKERRWNRYDAERHLGRNWSTDGLKRRMGQLETIIKLGSSTRV